MLSLGQILLPASSFADKQRKLAVVLGQPVPTYKTVSPIAVRHVSTVNSPVKRVFAPKSIINASFAPEEVPEPEAHVGDIPPNIDVLPAEEIIYDCVTPEVPA